MHKFRDAVDAKNYANFLLTNPSLVWYNISALLRHPAPATMPTKRVEPQNIKILWLIRGKEDFQILSVLMRKVRFELTSFTPLCNCYCPVITTCATLCTSNSVRFAIEKYPHHRVLMRPTGFEPVSHGLKVRYSTIILRALYL